MSLDLYGTQLSPEVDRREPHAQLYTIESQLGQGGMGVVYKARDAHLDRAVAIKILPPDKVADPVRRQRFVHEAKAASALNHPGIVTIHDIRSEQGIDFIVMEYVRGKTLEQTIPSKGLPVTMVRYAIQIADALASAHDAGIIHRDLKPSNVMVLEDGRIKILDFGLAKLVEPENSSDAITRTASLTGEGLVVGTASYMSPEQAEGRRLDARSDIFSFGSVLYEMLTGTQPFTGDSRLSVLARIVAEDPTPPTRLGAAIPAELEKIVLRDDGGFEGGARGSGGGVAFGHAGGAAIAPPLDRGGGVARPADCGVDRVAGVAGTCRHRAAPSRTADHAARSTTLSVVFARRRPRSVHVDWTEAGQYGHLQATDRRRLPVASDDRSWQSLQPGLVAGRPRDCVSAR